MSMLKAKFHWRNGTVDEIEVLDEPPPLKVWVVPAGELAIRNIEHISRKSVLFYRRDTGPRSFVYEEA